jgi:hypothetical protein
VLEEFRSLRDSEADEVIETAIRLTFDIKINWRSTECEFRLPKQRESSGLELPKLGEQGDIFLYVRPDASVGGVGEMCRRVE